jgi:hypothetical protein
LLRVLRSDVVRVRRELSRRVVSRPGGLREGRGEIERSRRRREFVVCRIDERRIDDVPIQERHQVVGIGIERGHFDRLRKSEAVKRNERERINLESLSI